MAQDPWSRPTVFWNQSWTRICELSRKKEGEGFVFFCGSQGCRKTFKNELAYWQHLWSKCDTPGHPSREIVKRWSNDKPFVAVSGDPDHPDPQWVEKQQKELKEKMRKEIQDHEDEKAKKLRQAQGKEEESSSTGSGSTDSEDDDEVSKAAKKVGIAVESLGPVGPEDSDIPEIPDGESLVAFLEDKKAEKAAKKEKVLAEESAASKRKSGVTEAGKRMLDQTLDEIVGDIKEEVPPSHRGMPSLDFQSHRPHQPVHQRRSPQVWSQRRLRQRFHLQVSQFLQSLSRRSQRIMIASWKLAKLVLVAAELIRT